MKTFTGREIDLKNFKAEDIDLRDIVVSLSRQNRYLGHIAYEWSVGQHLILNGMIANVLGLGIKQQQVCLLHDAHEYIYQDIISPILKDFPNPEYMAARDKADDVIYEFFNLSKERNANQSLIKKLDKVTYVIEQIHMRPKYDYASEKHLLHADVIRTVDYLNSAGFTIDSALIKMNKSQVAQNLLEVFSVMHFENTNGVELIYEDVDQNTIDQEFANVEDAVVVDESKV